MKNVTIDWHQVRILMLNKRIDSYADLSVLASVNKNTLGKPGAFSSVTLGKLISALQCDPCEIMRVENGEATHVNH